MCGIAGVASADASAPGDGARAAAGSLALAHRGPDGSGMTALPGCALAHRRLAILDLSDRAAQPMASADGRHVIVFNGEIYNHVELRRDLERRHPYRSTSDTETILHLYAEKGLEALALLRGMFALAIWDTVERRLVLARDRLGKKPIHYAESAERILFASEIPALFAMGVPRRFDPSALGPYLALGYVPAPATAIEGVKRLGAGSVLVYEKGHATVSRYAKAPGTAAAPPGAAPASAAEAARRLRPLLDESVRVRLRSDVPIGVFLSGGLDSSIVAAIAARESGPTLDTFTVVFDETGYDESKAARETARFLGTTHHEIRVAADAAAALPALIRRLGEPLADSSLVAVQRLSEAVRGHVKVALSGDGGDEVFLGYDRYRAHRLAARWKRLPALARRTARASIAALPGARGRRNVAGRAGRFLAAAEASPFDANDRWICRFHPADQPALLTPEGRNAVAGDPLAAFHSRYDRPSALSALDAVAGADLEVWLPDDVLRKVDGASMGSALEVRSPLLDHELVAAAVAIPAEVRMPGSRGKAILRECARGLVPESILTAPKSGFGLPVDRWLRAGSFRDLARDLLTSPLARLGAWVHPSAPRRLLDEHEAGTANHDEPIFTLLVLEIFLREVVEGRA
ncbi:MAG: asparagine synthase (glutamine-hydrolyzing) [Acidobacteria bacterium]|nr:asparagine synthase (glutamine-hydrolyzing) [Acidobacteriota bacterium]